MLGNKPSYETILIMEDEQSLQEIYRFILCDVGFRVCAVSNGIAGLYEAERNAPDLILLDLMMPVLGGVETLKKLRKKSWGKKIPVIILTNIGKNEVPEEIIDEYVIHILVKVDLMPDELVEKVKQTLNSQL